LCSSVTASIDELKVQHLFPAHENPYAAKARLTVTPELEPPCAGLIGADLTWQLARFTAPGNDAWSSPVLQVSLCWIYVHIIREHVRHTGHADILREQIDGATGD
jgi:hypothetical protein